MSKAKDHRTPDLFEVALRPSMRPGSLAGLSTQIAHLMSAAVRECGLDRYEIAAQMSALLGEDVSKSILDAYTSEARESHNVSAYRFLAFVLVTGSFERLDELVKLLGCRLLIGEEAQLAQLVRLEASRREIDDRIKDVRRKLGAGRR